MSSHNTTGGTRTGGPQNGSTDGLSDEIVTLLLLQEQARLRAANPTPPQAPAGKSIFEVQGPDGRTYEVEAGSMEEAVSAFSQMGSATGQMPLGSPTSQGPPTGVQRVARAIDNRRRAEQQPQSRPGGLEGTMSLAAQGAFLGAGDEINAGLSAVLGAERQPDGTYSYLNYDKPMRERYETELAKSRNVVEQYREARPVAALAAEMGGAIAAPGAAAARLGSLGMKGVATTGAATGAAYEFNSGEGTASERMEGVGTAAALGGVFGVGFAKAAQGLSAGYQTVFQKAEKAPTIANLRAAKDSAYAAVDRSGEVFSGDDMSGLFQRVTQELQDGFYVPETEPQTRAALKLLESRADKPFKLSQLDRLRQNLWGRYNRSGEVGILDVIRSIDDLIASKGSASAEMTAARAAHAQYAKTEMLESAFERARTSNTASGNSNLAGRYKSAVASILNNPKKAKWFSPEEQQLMQAFLKGDAAERIARQIGKFSPTNSGLMAGLNLVAATIDPVTLAASGTAAGANKFAATRAQRGASGLVDTIGGNPAQKPTYSPSSGPLGGISGGLLNP